MMKFTSGGLGWKDPLNSNTDKNNQILEKFWKASCNKINPKVRPLGFA